MAVQHASREPPAGESPASVMPISRLADSALESVRETRTSTNDGSTSHRQDGHSQRIQQDRPEISGDRDVRKQDSKKSKRTRNEHPRQPLDRRQRNEERQFHKRRRVDENGDVVSSGRKEANYMSIQFPDAEIAAEERRPKRKVAVLIGYAGSGYHGMQINQKDKTIEGDIFAAFVAAGAISKANADDPRKSSLMRCARTDKGVHAAGNVLSLKLIIEDPEVVDKINAALPPQIRTWGIQRTQKSFSCYQNCDSRWYEYLMPSYCLLPPHPASFLGKKILDSVKERDEFDDYSQRMADVKGYWEEVEEKDMKPILRSLDPEIREEVMRRMHTIHAEERSSEKSRKEENMLEDCQDESTVSEQTSGITASDTKSAPQTRSNGQGGPADFHKTDQKDALADGGVSAETQPDGPTNTAESGPTPAREFTPVELALRQIKAAYITAKRRYRVTADRRKQLQEALDRYVGTKNFHNYTVQKKHSDPSAKRHIKSFLVSPEPVQIKDTQWLSLKVHGQSFMMHQIRKMVGLAALATRCATPLSIVEESYASTNISIPKAPGLGLLLERPVFDNYNQRVEDNDGREAIDFDRYAEQIQEFKDTQIYRRIFEQEEKENSFHTFFNQIDNFKSNHFLWVARGGVAAAHRRVGPSEDVPEELAEELGNEDGDPEGGEG